MCPEPTWPISGSTPGPTGPDPLRGGAPGRHQAGAKRGQAGVRKRVVTEQQHRTVPVEREELRIQREPIKAGEGDSDAEITADERTIELREEQPVVDKRVVPKERVRIGKEVVRDQERVSEPVRKEQVEVEAAGARSGEGDAPTLR